MEEKIKIWGFHNPIDEIKMLDEGYVALRFKDLGNLLKIESKRECYYEQFKLCYPTIKKESIPNTAGQLFRFVTEAKIGDYIVFPTKFDRKVNIGIIESDYFYDESNGEYPHKRKIKWLKKGNDRSLYTQGAQYEFGSYLSFFEIKNYTSEHIAVLNGKAKKNQYQEENAISIDAIEESTKDYILKELSANYKGYDFETVVSDLLNAMGFKTKISPKGGDRGKDIIAYRDELPPRILVQVKSKDEDINEDTVKYLKATLKTGDYGLFVTLSNFKKNAKDFLDNNPEIKSINGSEFVDLLLKYYDKMPDNFKEVIRLKKVYMPLYTVDED